MEARVTGVMVYYYHVCKKKLWYFLHFIEMEEENEAVQIGKMIDESSYDRENKHINIDNVISIDFIREKNILHEVKKSRKIEEASIWQLKYYLHYLKKLGVEGLSGQIDYPLLKQTIRVELGDDDEKELEKQIAEIVGMSETPSPVKVKRIPICKKCAYHDLCWI